jgi:hypothetical protein
MIRRIHGNKCFIKILYIPSSVIERRVPACVPEHRYGNFRLPSIPDQEDHGFSPWVTGKCPASPVLQDGVKRHNKIEKYLTGKPRPLEAVSQYEKNQFFRKKRRGGRVEKI